MYGTPFYADSFETLHVILLWSEDVHAFLNNPQIVFLAFVKDVNLDIFGLQCYQYMYKAVPCFQLLLQLYTVLFETLHVLMSWPEDMNVLRIKF